MNDKPESAPHPALGQFALEERDQLLARVAEQAREIERLNREAKNDAIAYTAAIERQNELRKELVALKARPSGVVLPKRSTERGIDGELTYTAKVRNRCLDEVARLNSSLVSAGDDAFCDDHCTWLDHHPSCARAAGATVKDCLTAGGVDERAALTLAANRLDRLVLEVPGGYWRDTASEWAAEAHSALTAGRAAVPSIREFADEVKQLCKDFSDLQNRPYMGDVTAAIDGLYEQFMNSDAMLAAAHSAQQQGGE